MSDTKKNDETTADLRGHVRAELRKAAPAIAARMDNAERNFLLNLCTLGEIDAVDARAVLKVYRAGKVVKMDAISGTMRVKHGALLDRATIRRVADAAAGRPQGWKRNDGAANGGAR